MPKHHKYFHFAQDIGWYTRIAIASRLKPYINKSVLKKNHGWDRTQAERDHYSAVAEMKAELAEAEAALKADQAPKKAEPRAGQLLSPRRLAEAYYQFVLEDEETKRSLIAHGHVTPDDHDWQMATFRRAHSKVLLRVASGRASDKEADAAIGHVIDWYRSQGNTKAERGSEDWRFLARSFAGIQLEGFKRTEEIDAGDFTGQPKHPLLVKPKPAPDDPLRTRIIGPDSEKPLSELVSPFLAERKPGVQAQHQYRVVVRIFEEVVGDALPVYSITRQHIHTFKRALAELPRNATKLFRGMTAPEAIAANKRRAKPHQALHVRSINDRYLATIASLLNWCAKNDLIPDNPASGIKVDAAEETEKPKDRFSSEDMPKLFGKDFKEPDGSMGERQWAMLMSLFNGARASEMGQMKLSSIRTERGILVFAVEEKTKNVGSQRLIPVHSKLIELGFNDYINALRKRGETHVFPVWYRKSTEAKASAIANNEYETIDNYYPRFIPRRFNDTYLPKIGIDSPKKTWHSLRHTFVTSGLKMAGVKREDRWSLQGRADNSTEDDYLHDLSLEQLRDAIEKITYDGFPL